MEHHFLVTLDGAPKYLPWAGTVISTCAVPPPRTWVKLLVNGRIVAAFLIDEPFDEAVRRRELARTA